MCLDSSLEASYVLAAAAASTFLGSICDGPDSSCIGGPCDGSYVGPYEFGTLKEILGGAVNFFE